VKSKVGPEARKIQKATKVLSNMYPPSSPPFSTVCYSLLFLGTFLPLMGPAVASSSSAPAPQLQDEGRPAKRQRKQSQSQVPRNKAPQATSLWHPARCKTVFFGATPATGRRAKTNRSFPSPKRTNKSNRMCSSLHRTRNERNCICNSFPQNGQQTPAAYIFPFFHPTGYGPFGQRNRHARGQMQNKRFRCRTASTPSVYSSLSLCPCAVLSHAMLDALGTRHTR